MRALVLPMAMVVASLLATPVLAGDGGAGCCSDNVCQLVKTTIKKKVICYGCKCEDFCVPGKSCRDRDRGCSCHAKANCGCKGKCSCGCEHAPDCRICDHRWTPGCATLMTRKKLVKYELTKEVPGWKWKVVKGSDAKGCGCAAMIKPAPAGARLGDTFEATEDEIMLVSAQLAAKAEPKPLPKKQAKKGLGAFFGSLLK